MLDAAQAESAVLGVGYLGRACPQFDAAAAQASSGAVGKIGFVRVRRSTAAPKGPAHDAALESLLHDIDWVAANFGPVTVVFAQTVFRRPVNWALITLTLGKGPIVQGVAVAANDDDAPLHADIELCGESGMIQFRSRDPILTVTSQSANANRVRTGVSPLAPPIVSRRLARFFDAAGGRMPRRQLNHEMHIVRVFEALLESAREGRAVEIGS
jgi:predicted dehydrogenase